MEWRNGPSLNDKRSDLVAVVCHDKVYAIGGFGGDDNYDNDFYNDNNTIWDNGEHPGSMTTRQNNSQWTRLQCRLSSPQRRLVISYFSIWMYFDRRVGGRSLLRQTQSLF